MLILTESHINVQSALFKVVIAAALSSLFLGSLITAAPAHADGPLAGINIQLTGTVVALGCTVDPGDVNKPVNLGGWATKSLKKSGQTTSQVPFSIHMTGCTASGVTTAFTGTKDKVNPELLALKSDDVDYASGVAVQIMDNSGKRIPMGENAPRGVVNENGNVILNFRANYVATGDDSVRPGLADADTEFTLSYD
ncbi:type-1 fimbrial protein, A chain (plasmid) [Serratia marcescens]|nr:type-1 fimbrial protein, A chain [Serratia marcescens]